MKQGIVKITSTILLLTAFASCTKEAADRPAKIQHADAETGKLVSGNINFAVKKLTKITRSFTPYFNFGYDAQGRLVKVFNSYQTTTYTYGAGTFAMKKTVVDNIYPKMDLSGKTNAKGYVTYLEGYVYDASMKIPTKRWYQYNSLNQITQIKTESTMANGPQYTISNFEWKDGNLVKETRLVNNVLKVTNTFTYNLNQPNIMGIWCKPFDLYADNFLGVRSKHLLTKVTETFPGVAAPVVATETWKLNAEGYPVSSKLDTPYSNWGPLSFEYYFQ